MPILKKGVRKTDLNTSLSSVELEEKEISEMSLNDLFMQILESEQKARERKNLLNESECSITKYK